LKCETAAAGFGEEKVQVYGDPGQENPTGSLWGTVGRPGEEIEPSRTAGLDSRQLHFHPETV